MPKVSVILTSHNHAKYLRESIESVLNQTFSDFELLIGDDASTDESWDIIQSYSDPRIYAYRHEINMGGGIINELVLSGKISGEYIAIHHSDDIWEADKLEKQVTLLDSQPGVGAVFTWAQIISENGQPLEDKNHFYYNRFEQPNRSRHEWLNYFFYHGNVLCHPSVLIRKTCYDNCGLYRYGLAQIGDFDMWVRLCLKYEIHVLPEKLIRFRVRANEMNTSGNRQEVNIRVQFEFLQMHDNYCDIKTPEDFIQVFPTAQKYFIPDGYDVGFALAMIALEGSTFNPTKLFGLKLLFEALNDPERSRKINSLYHFRFIDFIALTADYDIFSIRSLTTFPAILAEKEQTIAEKENMIFMLNSELATIKGSRAWKIVLFLRRIKAFFTPHKNLI